MSEVILHYNGRWEIARLGLFTDMSNGKAGVPIPAWYGRDDGLICLCGDELVAAELLEPTDFQINAYETGRIAGAVALSGSVTGRFEGHKPIEEVAKDETPRTIKSDVNAKVLKLSELKGLARRDEPVTDEMIMRHIQGYWRHEQWGLMDCDRCPHDRGARGRDEPCDACPMWERLIADFRKRNKL